MPTPDAPALPPPAPAGPTHLRKAGTPMGTTCSSSPSREAGRKVSTKPPLGAPTALGSFSLAPVTCSRTATSPERGYIHD